MIWVRETGIQDPPGTIFRLGKTGFFVSFHPAVRAGMSLLLMIFEELVALKLKAERVIHRYDHIALV